MGVDHGGFDIGVPKKLLNSTNVVAVLKEMGGEGVAKGMAARRLCDARRSYRCAYGFLQGALAKMMTILEVTQLTHCAVS